MKTQPGRLIALVLICVVMPILGCGDRHQVAVKASSDSGSKTPPLKFEPVDQALLEPANATEKAPDIFQVRVETTQGEFLIDVNRDWSPHGADRFYNLVKIGFFEDIAIFRAVDGFMFQFGIHGNPKVSSKWTNATFPDDPPAGTSNTVGAVTFAKTGAPNSRSTQIFINLADNSTLDGQGFTPFGMVTEGQGVIGQINTEYGENNKQVQPFFKAQGNAFIRKKFPNADYIKSMEIIEP